LAAEAITDYDFSHPSSK